MSKETLITSRDPKGLHAVGLFEAAYNKSKLNDARAQRLNEHGDEFQADIVASIKKHAVSNQFADEEVESSYVYPKGYKVKGITAQTLILRQLINGIGFSFADVKLAEQPLPPNIGFADEKAEGWFAIPRWQRVAKTYGEALEKVLELIKQQHKGKFHNCCEGKLGEQYLRQHERTAKKLQVLGYQQKDYDILVVPAQFGLCHRGRSVRRAREVFTANEFGLGAFQIGCMLLTHPERLQHYDDLWIDCAGDEYAPGGDGVFSLAPFFRFCDDGWVRFDSRWFGDASSDCGSASGFLPSSFRV